MLRPLRVGRVHVSNRTHASRRKGAVALAGIAVLALSVATGCEACETKPAVPIEQHAPSPEQVEIEPEVSPDTAEAPVRSSRKAYEPGPGAERPDAAAVRPTPARPQDPLAPPALTNDPSQPSSNERTDTTH